MYFWITVKQSRVFLIEDSSTTICFNDGAAAADKVLF